MTSHPGHSKLTPVVSGTTMSLPLVGHPVAQVRTPAGINAWFAGAGVNALIFPVDIPSHGIAGFFETLRAWENCCGCSVTVPHKQAAYAAMDAVTERARFARSVNIIRRERDGTLTGDQTDGLAFVLAVRKNGLKISGSKVLLAGAGGGAGAAIVHAICSQRPAQITLVEPDQFRRDAIIEKIVTTWPSLRCSTSPDGTDYDLAINASAQGMNPDDAMPIDPGMVRSNGLVADVITKPAMTQLLSAAAAQGLSVQDGNEMADCQLEFQMRHLQLWPVSAIPNQGDQQ